MLTLNSHVHECYLSDDGGWGISEMLRNIVSTTNVYTIMQTYHGKLLINHIRKTSFRRNIGLYRKTLDTVFFLHSHLSGLHTLVDSEVFFPVASKYLDICVVGVYDRMVGDRTH